MLDRYSSHDPEPDLLAVSRHPLTGEVSHQLTSRCGVAGGEAIVIGVSGGCDSTALLLTVRAIASRGKQDQPDSTIIATHVNHHLRGDSDEDEAHLRVLCEALGVALRVKHIQPNEASGNLYDNARRMRYEALKEIAVELGAVAVAVAHHGDDQLETMLMALCRGAGLDGLSAMAWSRPLCDSIQLIRPMLGSRRRDCEQLCRTAGVRWRDDPANLDPSRSRARLRREVLPILEKLWPGAAGRATAAADSVRAGQAALEAQLDTIFGPPSQSVWQRKELSKLDHALLTAGLYRVAASGTTPNRRSLDEAARIITSDTQEPKTIQISENATIHMTAQRVRIELIDQTE